MNKKILEIVTVLIGLAMLATPVLAIGPQNAVKSNNPHMVFSDHSVQLFLPNGMVNEWITVDPSHVQIKPATEFQMKNVYIPASASEVLYNKWNYLSEDVFQEFLISVGFEPDQAVYVSHIVFPGGVYYKEVYVGN